MKRIICFLFLLTSLSAATAQHESKPYVILVSFDGFRYDYVKNFNPPNFKSFIAQGSQAEALIPSFPSKTFPNHYSLVTGLYPGNHGLVDNSFYDRVSNEFYGMRKKELVVDPYLLWGHTVVAISKTKWYEVGFFFLGRF
jgi:predicted AlkP superfamily pyrophosphatase or phosphodiesterase